MTDSTVNTSASPSPNVAAPPVIDAHLHLKRRRGLWLGVALLVAVVMTLLFVFNPAQHSFYPMCFFYRATGWQCPGCGGLRAAHQLLHGHLWTAFQYNPLLVGAAPVVLGLMVRRWLRGPRETVAPRMAACWAWTLLFVVVAFWIVRNLPIEFFRQPSF